MKSLSEKQSKMFFVVLFIAFCWMSNDDLKQQEYAQKMAQGVAK